MTKRTSLIWFVMLLLIGVPVAFAGNEPGADFVMANTLADPDFPSGCLIVAKRTKPIDAEQPSPPAFLLKWNMRRISISGDHRYSAGMIPKDIVVVNNRILLFFPWSPRAFRESDMSDAWIS